MLYKKKLFFCGKGDNSNLNSEKLTDDRRRTTSDGKSSHCLWQGELKRLNSIGQQFH
jgi:hypothetical protein